MKAERPRKIFKTAAFFFDIGNKRVSIYTRKGQASCLWQFIIEKERKTDPKLIALVGELAKHRPCTAARLASCSLCPLRGSFEGLVAI